MQNLQNLVSTYINLIFRAGLIIVVLATYFLFTNLTSESFDMAKFLVLIVFVCIMLILTSAKFAIENKVNFKRTPFDLPLILLLVVGIVSTVFSHAPFVSLLGYNIRVHGSLASFIAYILFYFVLTQNLRTQTQIKTILNLSILFGAVLSLLSLASYFGIKTLPITTTGSSFSTTAILALLIPIVVSEILHYKNFTFMVVNTFFLALFGVTLGLTGSMSTWVAGGAGLLITFFVLNPTGLNLNSFSLKPQIAGILTALVVTVLAVGLSFVPPAGKMTNPLYQASKNFPREVTLDYLNSWKISVSAFRDSPFWGAGPSTYLFNFTTYKPIEFNNSKYWNIRFDSAFNEYFQVLANFGGLGLLALLSLTALFLTRVFTVFKSKESLNVGLGVSGLGFFIILALHASTLPFFVIGLLVLACFWTLNTGEGRIPFFSNLVNMSSEQISKVEALPSIILTVSIALVLFTAFFGGKIYLADYHHKNALKAVAQNNGVVAYNELIASEKLNPWSDLYRTDLAQVNFALANAIALSKGPTATSPQGSLTDQDKQNIQTLLQQSITEGRTAVTLSPRSAINWEILALLYRQIAGVAQNALLFSLDSYGRAIFNDPLNPALRLNVGGVYYAVKSYDQAIRFFTDAINLKPDYANGYYNLSVALRDKGDLPGAIQAGEKVVTLVDKGSSDYKIATDYLADLKVKAGGPPTEPPAAGTTGALQEQKLPKVINLPKPENIATPEAIKKPSPSPSAQP